MKTPLPTAAVHLKAPYLILVGNETNPSYAKTGFGIVDWRPDRVAGQLRFDGRAVDLGVPDMSVAEAAANGVNNLVIGVAPIGGSVPDSRWPTVVEPAGKGMDIMCGLHLSLFDNSDLVAAAAASGARLIDIRRPPAKLSVGTGVRRSGKRLLTVGTDCAVGKKYTALALNKTMQDAGMNSTFRATGQTGIMFAGEGIAVDAVVADFVSGAAEQISPDNDDDHWDVIEGQGSLFHPGYSGVSLGLLHGLQPDAFVLCHDATRTTVSGWEHFDPPSVQEAIDLHVLMGRRTNPDIACVGVSVNTSKLPPNGRLEYLANLGEEIGVPCIDPLVVGCSAIINRIKKQFPEGRP